MSKEPNFGGQCKDNSSCRDMPAPGAPGEPSGRMRETGDLRSEPSFPNTGIGKVGGGTGPTVGYIPAGSRPKMPDNC